MPRIWPIAPHLPAVYLAQYKGSPSGGELGDHAVHEALVVQLLEPVQVPEGHRIDALAARPLGAGNLVAVGDTGGRRVRLELQRAGDAVEPALQLRPILIQLHE